MIDAASILKNGGVIVYPTDTAYAIGCDATNEAAIKKIFEIKGREASKTVPLIAADREMVSEWAELSAKAERLAKEYWPGPLTLVLPLKKQMLKQVQHDGFVAMRVPASATARALSAELGAPIVSTSANRAGEPTCYSVASALKSLGESFGAIDSVVDEGELPEREVSTIVKVWDNNLTVIREGAISVAV